MDSNGPCDVTPPDVRIVFASRLKQLRIMRGYNTARMFSDALGIEQNRYTRYERAEVEPSLTMIDKICQMLDVMPNELLGYREPKPDGRLSKRMERSNARR
jgi:transcriptional regulator with XRE-family HTH domain